MHRLGWIIAWIFALAALPAAASVVPHSAAPPVYLGHIAYQEVDRAWLAAAPADTGLGPCTVHRDMLRDLAAMTASARADGVAFRAVSCFRSVTAQSSVFCHADAAGRCRDPAERARSVGPPGFSEHATGYAIDFGALDGDCPEVDPCFARTEAGRWLARNGPRFGFELSFPEGNRQHVSFEPWHWRWVGLHGRAGTDEARARFAAAHARFPAAPAVPRAGTQLAARRPDRPMPQPRPRNPERYVAELRVPTRGVDPPD